MTREPEIVIESLPTVKVIDEISLLAKNPELKKALNSLKNSLLIVN